MSRSSLCPDLEDLAAWIDGRADETLRARLADHLGSCDHCALVVDEVLAFTEELEQEDEAHTEGALTSFESAAPTAASETVDAPPLRWPAPVAAPRSVRRRFWPYVAAAALACAAVISGRLLLDRPPSFARLSGELADHLTALAPRGSEETTRGEGQPLSREELVAVGLCKEYLLRPESLADPAAAASAPRCFQLLASYEDLAWQAATSPRFSAWLERAGAIHTAACTVLERAWPRLDGSRQAVLAAAREACRAELTPPPPAPDRDHSPAGSGATPR